MAKSKSDDYETTAGSDAEKAPVLGAEDFKTEQEKATKLDPVGKAEPSPGPVETIEEQGIGARTPYPTGNPPATKEST